MSASNMAATILVTGSSTGFGRLTVETLARQGHAVLAGIRDIAGKNQTIRDELRALAENEPLALEVVELDVTNDSAVDAAVQHLVTATGRLDVVVNNAGVAYSGPIEAFTVEQAQALFNINGFGVMRVNRAVLPQMRACRSAPSPAASARRSWGCMARPSSRWKVCRGRVGHRQHLYGRPSHPRGRHLQQLSAL